jgi:protein-S-isoprenylcysteine O-methyltransferase Ste14
MPRWLYFVPLQIVIIGWFAFGLIFFSLRKRSRDKTRKADRASIATIILQGVGFGAAWSISRPQFTPFLPFDWHVQYLVAVLILLLVVSSIWFIAAAVRTLGKQWSLQARVLETHELIRSGPYGVVRHPIYTGMFGMLIAASLAYGHWSGLLIASGIYLTATLIRIRMEERLLREQFGGVYDGYARNVPAFIPGLGR